MMDAFANIKMKKPPRLRKGDRVAAISLSRGVPGVFPHKYQAGKAQFEHEFGVQVVESRHALHPPDWIARNPKARADDLMEAFSDPTINGIISTIGGDDSVRILPHINLDVIRHNPKIFMGYSDTTITHMACYKAGLISFYGPAFMSGFAENGGMFPYMVDSVRRTLFDTAPVGVIKSNKGGWTAKQLAWNEIANQKLRRPLNPPTGWRVLQGSGAVNGHLVGGCVAVLEFLKGTDWWPKVERWDQAILFLETDEEASGPLLFKRQLRNYGSQGILHRLAGLIIGRPGGANFPIADFDKYDDVVREVLSDELGLESLPVITQMDFGHTDPMFVLPYGVNATMDCQRGILDITESAVV